MTESRQATVRLVDENAAGGKVREVFDDIKRTKNIDFVPAFWRALAPAVTPPGSLRRVSVVETAKNRFEYRGDGE